MRRIRRAFGRYCYGLQVFSSPVSRIAGMPERAGRLSLSGRDNTRPDKRSASDGVSVVLDPPLF